MHGPSAIGHRLARMLLVTVPLGGAMAQVPPLDMRGIVSRHDVVYLAPERKGW